MKKLFVCVALLSSLCSIAQKKKPFPDSTKAKGAGMFGDMSSMFGGKANEGPKPYKDVITEKAITKKGLFTVHKVEEKYYFEIPDTLLGREILSVVRFAKVPTGAGYGGELANQNTLTFEKGPNNTIFLRVITLINTADSTQAIYKAVTNSNVNSIASAFNIAAKGIDSLHPSYVIDVTEFFRGDNQPVSIGSGPKKRFSFNGEIPDRSYIESMNTYEMNTEIRTVKTYSSGGGGFSFPGMPSSSLPAGNAAGAVTLELNTSLLLLPKVPMAKRFADKRVGYFTEEYTQYSDDQQHVDPKEFATRWRLEPKDSSDYEKWKKGELVEPKKQ